MCADFNLGYKATAVVEGGYTLDPHETWRGIDRVEQPGWRGWALVDKIKASGGGNHSIPSLNEALVNAELQSMVLEFFKANFWDMIKGDQITDQAVANKVYDAAVNMGAGTAIRMVQKAVGVPVDGIIGPHTIAAINAMTEADELAKFKSVREEHYEEIVGAHPEDQKYLKSWLGRC